MGKKLTEEALSAVCMYMYICAHNYYSVHICTAGLCVRSHWLAKNRLFSALLLKSLLLSAFSLSLNVSGMAYYIEL